MQREKTPEWREKQKSSRGIRRGQRYRLVFQFPIRELWLATTFPIRHGPSSSLCYLLNPPHHGPDAHGLSTVKSSMACSGCYVPVHHGAIYPNDMGHGKLFITALTDGQSQA
uniref:Uncharacterized protein n=1 Tax=Shigella flexneri 3a TaxID=424717 RepID=A0A896Z0W5_SHIFL|nr:hypothetical protein EMBNGEFE_00103 [Shigella flexneri 3a]